MSTKPGQLQVRQSGTFFVEALVNGFERIQSVHINVPKGFSVSANPMNSLADTVTFTATALSGATIDSIRTWTWVPDSAPGSTSVSCAVPTKTLTCKAVVRESGWMHVVARVNGHTEADSVAVTSIKCATDEPLLNHQHVRDSLINIYERGLASPGQPDGLEFIYSLRSGFGSPRVQQEINTHPAPECFVDVTLSDKRTVLALVHNHSTSDGTLIPPKCRGYTDPLPTITTVIPGTTDTIQVAFDTLPQYQNNDRYGGVSRLDWNGLLKLNVPKGIMIGPDSVVVFPRMEPGVADGNWNRSSTKKYNWREWLTSACH